MPRPSHHSFNDWLFYKLRLRYVLLGLAVVVVALWAADAVGWLPAPEPAQMEAGRAGD